MKTCTILGALLGTVCVVALNGVMLNAQEKAAPSTAEVHVVITDTAVRSNAVSFKPYLERFQKTLDNQYFLVFLATPKKNASLQRFNIQTEVSNSEILSPNNVWVPVAK